MTCANQDGQFLLLYFLSLAIAIKVIVWPAFLWCIKRGEAHRKRVLDDKCE